MTNNLLCNRKTGQFGCYHRSTDGSQDIVWPLQEGLDLSQAEEAYAEFKEYKGIRNHRHPEYFLDIPPLQDSVGWVEVFSKVNGIRILTQAGCLAAQKAMEKREPAPHECWDADPDTEDCRMTGRVGGL